MRIAVVALVSLIVGLGVGALLFRNPEPVKPPPTVIPEPCVEARADVAPARVAILDAGSSAAERCVNAEQAVQQLQAQLLELNAQLGVVQGKLDLLTEKERAEREGAPAKKPVNLAPRFEQEPMRAAVETALKQSGFNEATVTSVDCTEYPCIVYGTGMGSRDDVRKLEQAPALDAYDADGKSRFSWSQGADAGSTKNFGIAFTPQDGSYTDEVARRLQYRVKEYQKAAR